MYECSVSYSFLPGTYWANYFFGVLLGFLRVGKVAVVCCDIAGEGVFGFKAEVDRRRRSCVKVITGYFYPFELGHLTAVLCTDSVCQSLDARKDDTVATICG